MRKFSRIKAFIKDLLAGNKLLSLYFKNKNFRINLSLFLSILLNTVYVIFNAVYGIVYGSLWFISASVYYTILATVSYMVIKAKGFAKREPRKAHRAYLRIGALLLILDILMTPIMISAVLNNRPIFKNSFLLGELIVHFAFSFFRALYAIIQSRKSKNKGCRAAYTVRSTAALTSSFNLCIVLIPSTDASRSLLVFLAVFVSFLIFMLSLFLIVGERKAYKY